MKYWYLYVIMFFSFVGLVYMYLKNVQLEYEVIVMMLIKEDQKLGELVEEVIFDELKFWKKKNLVDEVLVFCFFFVMEWVVE